MIGASAEESDQSSWLQRAWRTGLQRLDQALFDPACASCGRTIVRGWVCPECADQFCGRGRMACPRCAMPVGPYAKADAKGCSECRGRPLGFVAAVALHRYDGPLRKLCLKLKHSGREPLARWLADRLADEQGEALRSHQVDLVVPVPLHWSRRLSRGYNQADVLASRLARRLELPLHRALRRSRPTRPLARLSPTERAEELRGAFRVRLLGRRAVEGRRVLLVDDILTSGATTGEAARVLKRAGASSVVVAVLARAEGNNQ